MGGVPSNGFHMPAECRAKFSEARKGWGFGAILHQAEILRPSSGWLHNDCLIVVAEIFKQPLAGEPSSGAMEHLHASIAEAREEVASKNREIMCVVTSQYHCTNAVLSFREEHYRPAANISTELNVSSVCVVLNQYHADMIKEVKGQSSYACRRAG